MANSSERRATANRLNAIASTGPISSEGKERSRQNPLRHGLAAETVVTDEERGALAESLDALNELLTPDHIIEADLVRRTAVARVRLRRCETSRESKLDGEARDALRSWDEKRRKAVRRQGQRLKSNPERTVAALEQSAFGCDWLIGHWQRLDAPLTAGIPWTAEQVEHALRLLGVRPDSATPHPLAQDLRALLSRSPDPDPSNPGPAPLAALRRFVADRLDRLQALRGELWDLIDGPEREAVRLDAIADAGRSSASRSAQRYEREAELSYHRNLNMIIKIRNENRRAAEADRKERLSANRWQAAPQRPWFRDPSPPSTPSASPSHASTAPPFDASTIHSNPRPTPSSPPIQGSPPPATNPSHITQSRAETPVSGESGSPFPPPRPDRTLRTTGATPLPNRSNPSSRCASTSSARPARPEPSSFRNEANATDRPVTNGLSKAFSQFDLRPDRPSSSTSDPASPSAHPSAHPGAPEDAECPSNPLQPEPTPHTETPTGRPLSSTTGERPEVSDINGPTRLGERQPLAPGRPGPR